MDLLPALLHLSAIHILMAMIPGPNTVVVSYCSAGISRAAGLKAALGIAAATFVWVALSLAGIGLVLAQAGELYHALRLAGAGYLVYVGWRMLRSAARPVAAGADPGPALPGGRSPFLAGLVTTLSNPKSAVFWTSVFALVVPPAAPGWFLAAAMGLVTLQSLGWYAAVALVLSTPFARQYYRRLTRWLDRVAGAVMILLGLRLADEVRAELSARLP
ncbi:LysE type translocator [Allostella vacuolata]|nr:LysE type translocator [Stella vacuolata]